MARDRREGINCERDDGGVLGCSDGEQGEFPLVRPDGAEVLLDYSAVPDIVPGLNLSILRPARVDETTRDGAVSD